MKTNVYQWFFILLFLLVSCKDNHPKVKVEKVSSTIKHEGKPMVLLPNEGEYIKFPDGRHAILKVTNENLGSRDLLMGTEGIPPGTGIPVHSHETYEEILFIHEGMPHLTLGDSIFQGEPGTTMYIPPGTWHGITGHHTDSTTVLFIFPETDIADFFRTVGHKKGENPPKLNTEDWVKVMEKHKMRAKPD